MFLCVTADTARASCPHPIKKAKCVDRAIKIRMCATFLPVEVFVNGCLITTVDRRNGKIHKMKLSGFGPGEYVVKVFNSRGKSKKRTAVCE